MGESQVSVCAQATLALAARLSHNVPRSHGSGSLESPPWVFSYFSPVLLMLHPLPNSFTHSPVDVPVQVLPAAGIPAPFPSLQFYVQSLDDS